MKTLTTSIRGTQFVLDHTYTLRKFVGSGSFGVVASAADADGAPCAIKKISNVFKNQTTAKRTLREIKLLLHFDHENVIGIHDLMCSDDINDLYVVTQLMDTDLHKVIRSPQPLSDQHVQYFLYQLLRGLKYIHSCSVLHRDLKPSNLLVNENCDLRITDFGLSRGVSPAPDGGDDLLTEYVVTRWYRAPEIVLSADRYTQAVDVWSVGCILAELLGRQPLFPGADHVQQLNCIIDVLGTPCPSELPHVPHKAHKYISMLPRCGGRPMHTIYPDACAKALNLLRAMLHWDPTRRITVVEALEHPYLQTFHNAAAEPVAAAAFDFNQEAATDPKKALFREVCRFRPHLATLAARHAQQHQQVPHGVLDHTLAEQQQQQQVKRSQERKRCRAGGAAPSDASVLPRYGDVHAE